MIDNREAARWRRIVDALRAEAARLGDPRARSRKQVEIGDTLFDRLGDAYGAAEAWLTAIDTAPDAPDDALRRLERLARESKDGRLYQRWVSGLRRAGRWTAVIDLMGRRADALRDPRKRCKLRLEAARLCAEKRGDVAGARRLLVAAAEDADASTLERVRRPLMAHLRETPHDEEAATSLARLLARCERPDGAIELLVDTAAHLRDLTRKAALLYEAAFLCERAGRLERAPGLLRDAMVYDPRREAEVLARLDALEKARPDPLTADALLDALIDAWDGLGRPERSQSLLAGRISAATGRAETDLRLRQARHAEEVLGDARQAFSLYQGVAATAREPGPAIEGLRRTAGGRPGTFETIADLCTRRGLRAELAALCTDEAALRADDGERAALLHRAGTLYEAEGDLDAAMGRFVEAFKLRPRELKYLEAGERLYRQRGDWAMVDRLLGLKVDVHAEESDRRAARVEQAEIRWHRLRDALGAYDALRDALRRLGDTTAEDGAFGMLEQLVLDPVGFEAIAGGLRTRAETEDDGARRLVELAGLHLDLRDERALGLSLLHEALDRAPTDGGLFTDVATRVGRHAGADAEAELLRSAPKRPLPDADRVAALRRAGRLLERRDPGEALTVWQALLAIDPGDAAALESAIAVAEGLGPSAATAIVGLLEPAIAGRRGPGPTPERLTIWQRALARAQARRVSPEAERAAWLGLLDHVPDDAEALAALGPTLRAAGEHRLWAERLAAAVEAAEQGGDPAIERRVELADLHADRLGEPGEAARWLLPLARQARPDLRPRVFALLDAAGDGRAAVDLARRILKQLTGPADRTDPETDLPARIEAAERLVRLAEAEGDESATTVGLLALSALRPDDPRPALRLAELARRTGDDDALLVALDRLAGQTPGPRGTPLRREMARLLTDRKSDPAQAIEAWQAVLTDAADDTEALAALQRLHAREGDDETVHRLLWRRQAATVDPDDRVALLREAAVVAEFRLGSPGEAMRAWRAVLDLDPENADALDELIRLAEDEGEFRATLRAAEVRVRQLAGADRADLARRMAEICAGPLGDDAAAVDWWRIVSEAEPEDGEALEALAEDAEQRQAVGEALVLWGRLATRGRGRLQHRALRRRAELSAEAGDPEGAMRAWRALAEARPDDPEPWAALQKVAEAADDPDAVAEALAGRIARETGPDRVAAQRDRARLLDEMGDPDAIAAWEAVLDAEPHDHEALAAVEYLYGAAGRPREMMRALDMLVAVAEPARGIGRLAAAAERMEEAGDAVTAFECWRRVHHLRGDVDRESLDAMLRLADAAGRWAATAEALAVSAGRSDDVGEQRGLMLEAAGIRSARLGDDRWAFAQVQAACALDPAHPEPLERLAALAESLDDDESWAGLAEAAIQAAEAAPERRAELLARAADIHERRRRREDVAFALLARAFEGPDCVGGIGEAVEEALVRLAARGGRWPAVIELFDTRARLLPAPADQAALLHRLGAVLEVDADDPESAFEQYLLALQLAPTERAIRDAAHRLAQTLDMWPVVERVMRLALENAEGPRARAAVLRALAELQAGPLGDLDKSFETLKRAFALAPGDGEIGAALEDAAAARGATASLPDFYADEAGWAAQQDDRIALYRAAVAAYKAQGRQVEAARILRKLDRLLPGDADLADERLDLLRMADDARPLAAALDAQIERSRGARRLTLLRELAAVRAERLDDAEGAEDAWRRVLEARPHDGEAFDALTASLTGRKAWGALDDALARRVERTTAAARRALMRRRADLLHRRLGRPVEGFALLAEVSRAEPTDLDLLDVLARRAPIADAWGELVSCAERAVAVAPRARVAEVLMLIGRTARDRLDDPRKALSALSKALERRPDDLPLAKEVAALMRARRQFGPLVALHRRLGPDLVAEPGEHPAVVNARWSLALSGMLADRLYRVDEAITVTRELVAKQSLNTDAVRRLRALCLRAQDGPGLHDAVERLAGLATGVERLSTLVDGARALAGMGEVERSVAVWRTVLAEAPGHPEAQRAVARQAARQEDWALMIEQLEARIRAAHGADERADLLCELGVLHQHRRGDPDAAAEAYARALAGAPSHPDALVGHVELARRGADAAALAGLAETLSGHIDRRPQTDETLRPLLVDIELDRAAQHVEDGDEDTPLAILEPLRARAPGDDRVGQALADALYGAGELRRAAALYAELPMPTDPGDEGESRAKQHLRRARALRAAGIDDPAMRHFEAATGHPTTRACALEQLANLQERAGRWEAAARLREKLADAVEDPQARRAAWVAAGLILEHRLGRAVRAMQAYDQAVDAGLGEPVLLGGILRLYREQARPERVLQVSERLLAGDRSSTRRAELWCDRAWALEASEDRVGAREARRTALVHDPASVEAAEGLLNGLESAGDVEQAETLDAARAALAGLQGPARVPLLIALRDWTAGRAAAAFAGPAEAPPAPDDAPSDGPSDAAPLEASASGAPPDAPSLGGPDAADGSAADASVIKASALDDLLVLDDSLAEASVLDGDALDDLLVSEDPDADPSVLDASALDDLVALDDAPARAPALTDPGGSVDDLDERPADDDTGPPTAAPPPAPVALDPEAAAALAAEAEVFAAELVALQPGDYDHRVKLAALLAARADRTDDPDAARGIRAEALPHRRAAVRLRPGATADLRALAKACDGAGRPRWSALPRGLLAAIGVGDPPPPLRDALPAPLTATARKAHLAGDPWRTPAGLLLNALHAWIARPLDALLREARGEPGRPAAEVDPALAAEATAVSSTLGLAFPAIRIDPDADAPMDLAGLAPPVPVIGRPLLEVDDPAIRRFELARGFELMRGCAAHAAYVPAGEARALFAAAVALARPDEGTEFALGMQAPPERVGWWAELLHGLLDTRRLDALSRFAGPVARGPRDAFTRWAEGTRRAADRVGLWVAGDPAAVIGWLWQNAPALAEHRPASPRGLRTLIDASSRIAAVHEAAFDDGIWALLAAADARLAEAPDDESAAPSLMGDGPSLDDVASGRATVDGLSVVSEADLTGDAPTVGARPSVDALAAVLSAVGDASIDARDEAPSVDAEPEGAAAGDTGPPAALDAEPATFEEGAEAQVEPVYADAQEAPDTAPPAAIEPESDDATDPPAPAAPAPPASERDPSDGPPGAPRDAADPPAADGLAALAHWAETMDGLSESQPPQLDRPAPLDVPAGARLADPPDATPPSAAAEIHLPPSDASAIQPPDESVPHPDVPSALEPDTTPPGRVPPVDGGLSDALRDDRDPLADLAAAAEAGPPRDLVADAAATRLVGAAEPGPARVQPGLDHLFDDLEGLGPDAAPTEAVTRADLGLPGPEAPPAPDFEADAEPTDAHDRDALGLSDPIDRDALRRPRPIPDALLAPPEAPIATRIEAAPTPSDRPTLDDLRPPPERPTDLDLAIPQLDEAGDPSERTMDDIEPIDAPIDTSDEPGPR